VSSRVSTTHADFAAFEAQFGAATSATRSRTRLRVTGWVGAAVISLGLCGAIAAGVIALIHTVG